MSSLARPADDSRGERMLSEVREGLSRPQKELSPKWFYDHRGSELFEEITRLPEYYLTRAERSILRAEMPGLVRALRPRALLELGAGSAEKTKIILDAMRSTGWLQLYVPVDVSEEFLDETAERLRARYADARIRPWVADIGEAFELPRQIPRPALFAFLGSTIGNFDRAAAVRLLHHVRQAMHPGDRLLLGADLIKDRARIEQAYNDTRGVTAEFNRNVLHVLNRELGAGFEPDAFVHRAFFNERERRIEMHLVSARDQAVDVPGVGRVALRAGESIRTEISCKYDREGLTTMLRTAALRVERWMTDDDGRFALVLAAPA